MPQLKALNAENTVLAADTGLRDAIHDAPGTSICVVQVLMPQLKALNAVSPHSLLGAYSHQASVFEQPESVHKLNHFKSTDQRCHDFLSLQQACWVPATLSLY